ncbi:MAG: hypothetical protein HFI93_05730 [Lachnospiraceae bacterium]|nr:hypothetical protein [Lachnospiraceae bacterium]
MTEKDTLDARISISAKRANNAMGSLKKIGGEIKSFSKGIKKAIDISSGLMDLQNVMDTALGNMSGKIKNFVQDVVEQFNISELALERFSGRLQNLASNPIPNLSINWESSAGDCAPVSDLMSDTSEDLTHLTDDMVSFLNVGQDVVAEGFASVFDGQAKSLKDYRTDLMQAAMSEWALKQGMDADMESMSQAEKVMLRYQYVMANMADGYKEAKSFGSGFADLLNDMISPDLFASLGSTIAGSLNTDLYVPLSLGLGFDFKNLGESIVSGFNHFFDTFDFGALAETLNVWVQGVWLTVKTALTNIEWATVWEGVKDFLGKFDLETLEIAVGAIALAGVWKLHPEFDLVSWASSGISGFLGSVPVVIENIKLLSSGELLEGDGFFTKLINAFAMSAGGAETFGGSIAAVFGEAALPIATIVASVAALAAGLGYVFAKNEEVRESFGQAASALCEGLQPVFEFFSGTLLPDLQAGWERILEILTPFGEFLEVVFISLWQDVINPALTYIGETVLPMLAEALANLWNNILVPFGTFLADVLEPIIKIVLDVLMLLWQNVIVPLAGVIGNVFGKAFEELCSYFSENFIPQLESVIKVLQFLWDNVLSPVVDFLWEILKPAFESVFGQIGEVISGLTQVFGGLIDFIVGIFTGDWGRAWEGVKKIFAGIWDALGGILKAPLNGAMVLFEGLANKIVDAWNWIKTQLNKLRFSIPEWVPVIGGKEFGFNFSMSGYISLPRFQEGGFPEDGWFRASHGEIMGRFDNGQSVVANNRQITQGIADAVYPAVYNAVSAAMRNYNGTSEIKVYIGDKEITDVAINGIAERANRTQKMPFPLYLT